MQKYNVVAVGRGKKIINGKKTPIKAIVCSVKEKKPLNELAQNQIIPRQIDDMPTDVVETGEIIIRPPLASVGDPTQRYRPAPGGVSIGHEEITAGTLGCWVKNAADEWMILSNNHVLANSNNAQNGDAILQPGPYDGGSITTDIIGYLEKFVEIKFTEGLTSDCSIANFIVKKLNRIAEIIRSSTRLPQPIRPFATEENFVDAALARPASSAFVTPAILQIGAVLPTISPAYVGMEVQKFGRTTKYTTGEVLQVDVAAKVGYGDNKVALFTDQLLMGPMSAGGDSGSLVVDMHNAPVGLLFAGSDEVTLCNRIDHVTSALGIKFV